MTSTALDAIIAIIVIGAAITALVGAPESAAGASAAGPTLKTLETGTTAVTYTLTPQSTTHATTVSEDVNVDVGSAETFEDTDGSGVRRTTSGSYAELLTRATLSTLVVEGRSVTAVGDDFRDAVTTATIPAIRPRTQVAVLWQPYPDTHLRATFTVGPTPPSDSDLSAASTAVPSGMPSARGDAQSAARTDGYAGVSRVLADRIVAGVFPVEQTSVALRGGYPVAPLVAHRYGRFGDAYEVDLEKPVSERRPADANDRLAAAVADRIESDLRAGFDSPEAAANAVRVDRVDLVVRRWD